MATRDERELLLKVKVDDDATRPLKQIGDAADDTKDDLQGMNLGLKRLDMQVKDTQGTIKTLREEIAKTGDLELIKDLSKQEARLKAFARQRKLLLGDSVTEVAGGEDEGRKSGKQWLGGFRSALSSGAGQVSEALSEGLNAAPLQVKAAVGGAIVAGAVVASSSVAAMLSGAVLAGLSGGAVAAGVASALHDPAVKQAGKDLGADLRDQMLQAGDSFKAPTLAAIGLIRREVPGIGRDLRNALEPAAGYVLPLTRGLTGLVKNVIPGLAAGIKAAEPVIAVMERRLPAIGDAISDALEAISKDGDNAAAGFETLLRLVEGLIRVGGGVVAWLTDAYDWVLKIQYAAGMTAEAMLGWVPGIGGTIKDFNQATRELQGTAAGVVTHFKSLKPTTDEAGAAARKAAGDFAAWQAQLDAMADSNLSARAAHRALEASIDAATEALKRNGATHDENTAKGRANADALDTLAATTNRSYEATLKQTGSQSLANAELARGRDRFVALAEQMGYSHTEAVVLAEALLKIKDRKVVVTADTGPALAAAKGIVARINSMKARINVYAEPSGGFGGGKDTGFGYSTGFAAGGRITGLPGPSGVDSGYIKAANDEHVLTADEVRMAGGHAAIEAWRRSLRSGQKAMSSTSGGSAMTGGGTQTVVVRFDTTGSDRSILGAFIRAIRDAGGNPAAFGLGV